MRTTRMLVLLPLAVALLGTVQLAPVAAVEGPLRSGRIVSGTGESPANFWVRGMEGCVGAPACSAWLQSACHPALAGRDPALHASIVDVGDLSDGVTLRFLAVERGAGINWGRLIVQFWTPTALTAWRYCGEILGSRLGSRQCLRDVCLFRIPSDARWMTITSSPDNTNIQWTLR